MRVGPTALLTVREGNFFAISKIQIAEKYGFSLKFKFEIEISISNNCRRACRHIDKVWQSLLGLLRTRLWAAPFPMQKLAINDFGRKLRFLLGHRKTGDLGSLKDVLQQLDQTALLSAHQVWLCDLNLHVRRVEAYLTLCEAYTDPNGDLNLATLAKRTHMIGISAHSNWTADHSLGPREDFGIAAASLFGVGCPTDDPSLPFNERQKLWASSDHKLWRLWCDGNASEFAQGYSEAILNDSLWFPERLEQEIALAAQRADPAPETAATEPSPPAPPSPEERFRWRLPLAATVVALGLLGAALMSKQPVKQAILPGAPVWIECLPEGGDVMVETAEGQSALPCPSSGLLPLTTPPPESVIHVRQGNLPVSFVHKAAGPNMPELWRPSPSFAKMLSKRRVVTLALKCPAPQANVRLDNAAWGTRRLSCSAPVAQITLLRPSEAFVEVTLTQPDMPEPKVCTAYLPVSSGDPLHLDPTMDCAGLPPQAERTFPLRALQQELDLVRDPATGLSWLTDPLALGSSMMWQGAQKWDLAEVLHRLEDSSGTKGWRIAHPQEVLAAPPMLFSRAAGAVTEIVALARMAECPSGLGRVALSLAPSQSHAEANAAIPLPCQLDAPEVGFWIAKSPQN